MYIEELFSAIVVAFFLAVSTSLWLYNLLTMKKEIEVEISSFDDYARSTCIPSKEVCVTISSLPDYSTLFTSVVHDPSKGLRFET
ncbi:hypothetical protein AC249_AIPGENE398 [Exaiptasia diaphana]|nr:hypothetical protein AC249_AIPGENE398 [Exaiptasia diaphana]